MAESLSALLSDTGILTKRSSVTKDSKISSAVKAEPKQRRAPPRKQLSLTAELYQSGLIRDAVKTEKHDAPACKAAKGGATGATSSRKPSKQVPAETTASTSHNTNEPASKKMRKQKQTCATDGTVCSHGLYKTC